MVLTTSFSMVASNYSDEKAKYFGLLEAAVGLGLVVGPPLGSIMYSSLGYEWAFYSTAIMVLINVILCLTFVPSKLNINPESNAAKRKTVLDAH